MKRRSKVNSEYKKILKNELEALTRANHSEILNQIDYSDIYSVITEDKKKVEVNYLGLEYAENGEMFEYVAKTGSFAENTARYFFRQLIDAIEHINKEEPAHRDIKPDNIMLDSEFNLKLGDLGFDIDKEPSYKMKGTTSYMAPEVLVDFPLKTRAADLFAATVTLFIMMTQRCPFARAHPSDEFYTYVIMKDWEGFWYAHSLVGDSPLNLSDEFKDLFSKMVVVSVDERLTLEEVKQHKWYNGPLPTHQEIFENFSYRKLVKNGQLNIEDIPPQQALGEDHLPPLPKENCCKSNSPRENDVVEAMQRMSKKYTRYFRIKDGDILIDQLR